MELPAEKNEKARAYRIGVEIGPYDPYWVQVREVVCQRLLQMGMNLVRLEIAETNATFYDIVPAVLADELLAYELDALISVNLPTEVTEILLKNGLPIVSVSDCPVRHPLFTCHTGLYQAARMAGDYIGRLLPGRGRVVCLGGFVDVGDDKGQSRMAGLRDALQVYPEISIQYIPAYWDYERAVEQARAAFEPMGDFPGDVVFGLSDSLALAARDACRDLGCQTERMRFVGINGDPLALAAIFDGSMAATVETSARKLGLNAAEVAVQTAQKLPMAPSYVIDSRLVTRENAGEIVAEKLIAIADIPTQLVGVNRLQQQRRLKQLEISSAINRRVGALLDRKSLSQEFTELIRTNFGYDEVQVLIWSQEEHALVLEGNQADSRCIQLDESDLLTEALKTGEPIFIPDVLHSQRYTPDPRFPHTRARVVLPIRLGDQVTGLLDLHNRHPSQYLRQEMAALQPLADQLGIALRNAELYSVAVKAREQAERADQLKTRLLANVSHELRAPLNVILGYSQAALQSPNPYKVKLPPELQRDLRYIYQGGEHLMRIINDLLDVSRAEIGELDLFTETIQTRPFLGEVFNAFTRSSPSSPKLDWRLEISAELPVIQADPVRLRQILLNLLSNSAKFTSSGHITLGAEIEPPNLHFWVEDTGAGISADQQERIFEPFVSFDQNSRRREGIGLGLSITRHLVALHHGTLSVTSLPGRGSTFHIYLPLPSLTNQPSLSLQGVRPEVLFVITHQRKLPKVFEQLAALHAMKVVLIQSIADLEQAAATPQPAVLGWDMTSAATVEWQIIQHLQTRPQFELMPFILFKKDDQEVDLRAGLTNVLLKPVNRRTLSDFVKSLYQASTLGAVLIADDDSQARQMYCQIVSDALPGYSVRAVEDGAQLLEAVKQEIPMLILLDLMMPVLDGFSVLQQLRADPRTARVPVVVISGQRLSLDDVQRLDYSRVTFHTKGLLSSDEAVALLREAFAGKDLLSQPTSRLVKFALVYLYQNYSHNLSRKELAEQVGVSENYLSQIFRQELGISPWECLSRLRIQKAKEMLISGEDTITQVATRVGFNDSAYFSRVFHKMTGCSPQEYRQQNHNN